MLLNIALHGMETAAGVRYLTNGFIRVDSPALIRYADDLVVHCHYRQDAIQIKARLAAWLAPRGLAFNEDKTRVVTLHEGYDFLGFNVRRYRNTPLIRPSKAAVRRIRERLRTELRSLRGHNAGAVIRRLNPITRGWAAYYRTQVSSRTFKALDQYLWKLTYKWALISHRNKSRPWVIARYFGMFNRARQDRWVFGDRKSGAFMHRFAWIGIVRHQIVRYRASPDDPALTAYWAWRRREAPLPISNTNRRLHQAQAGRCPICRGTLTPSKTARISRTSGNAGWPPTAPRSSRSRRARQAPTMLNTVSYTPTAPTAHHDPHLCPPTAPQRHARTGCGESRPSGS